MAWAVRFIGLSVLFATCVGAYALGEGWATLAIILAGVVSGIGIVIMADDFA